jgi:tripartite-type tricarboxylate transporter receptor subunit TctC
MQFIAKFIFSIFTIICSVAHATEKIEIVWGFNPGSNHANALRLLINQANQDQSKYQFVFVNRQGAGGSIAANHVASNPDHALVAMSSSFIVRPYFEQGQNIHNLDNFQPLVVQGVGSPLFLVSNKFRDVDTLFQQNNVNIGVSGMGSVSHLAANDVAKKIPGSKVVNFKNMVDAMTSAAGNHVDLAITAFSDSQSLVESGKLHVIGYTGDKKLDNFPGMHLKSRGMESITSSHAIYHSIRMDNTRRTEIRKILVKANQSRSVIEEYKKDLLIPVDYDLNSTAKWYDQQRVFWQAKINEFNQNVSKQ